MNEEEIIDNGHLYSTLAETSYMRNKIDKERYLIKNKIEDYFLDHELTDKYHSIYFNPDKKETVLSIRGTDIHNKQKGKTEDLITDAFLLFGLEHMTPRYKKSVKKLDEVRETYNDHDIVLTGHSLGGTIAREIAIKHDIPAHIFNHGNTVSHVKKSQQQYFSNILVKDKKKLLNNYVVMGDVISNSSLLDKTMTNHIYEKKDNHNAHSLNNFYKDI